MCYWGNTETIVFEFIVLHSRYLKKKREAFGVGRDVYAGKFIQ